jgi:hypothetical protein
MKRKKVLKSLDELSADSLRAESAESQPTKPKPSEPQLLAQALREILEPGGSSQDSEDQQFRHWGINE